MREYKKRRSRLTPSYVWTTCQPLLDGNDVVKRAELVLDAVCAFGVAAPDSIDNELVLVGARGKLDGDGIDAVVLLIRHQLVSRIPPVETTGDIDLLARIGAKGEGNGLEGDLFRLGGIRLLGATSALRARLLGGGLLSVSLHHFCTL